MVGWGGTKLVDGCWYGSKSESGVVVGGVTVSCRKESSLVLDYPL